MVDIVLLEPFDQYSAVTTTQGSMSTRWNIVIGSLGIQLVTGLGNSGKAALVNGQALTVTAQYAFTPSNKITMGFGFRVDTLVGLSNRDQITFFDAAGNHQWSLNLNAGGRFDLKGEGNAILGTSDTVFIPGAEHRICLNADISTGAFHFFVDGDADAGLTLAGLDIQDASATTMGILQLGNSQNNTFVIDDIILGINECVNWGPLELNLLAPTSDVVAEWTRSAGATNFSNVDDATFDVDATYNSIDTLNAKDIFGFADLTGIPETIFTVGILNIARKEESAIRRIKEILRLSGTDYFSAEHNLIESYSHYVPEWQLNPDTGVAWTAADINAIQAGYQYTSNS